MKKEILNQKKVQVLDCTIRDGGYVNKWNFDRKLVQELYKTVSASGVDVVEIGFRNSRKYLESGVAGGEWRCVSEEALAEITRGIQGVPISVMVDYDKCELKEISDKKDSLVQMYRIACHKNGVLDAIKACDHIHKKGYITSLQLMGIGEYVEKDFAKIILPLKEAAVDYVYFADSYGSLFPSDVARYIDIFRATEKKIGFHAHNSLQLAFANTLEALKHDIDIVDATVLGIGRGAGNLPLEVLIGYLIQTTADKKYCLGPVLDFIDGYFMKLWNDFHWGYTLSYMLSGLQQVHPDYAKSLSSLPQLSMNEMMCFLGEIKNLHPTGFDKSIIEGIIKSKKKA